MKRRDFLIATGALLEPGLFGAQPTGHGKPWYETMRRCGQTNFNERDPEVLDIAWWIDYWTSLKLDALLLSAGGIMAALLLPNVDAAENRAGPLAPCPRFHGYFLCLVISAMAANVPSSGISFHMRYDEMPSLLQPALDLLQELSVAPLDRS